ncbi:nucleotidyltransferase domain-containing protein [Streptomyces sp. NPDC001594]|uniref:nucleotidyltransferase domain-containing protein n=1 Tax=Streptomyces sp. NPDC001594 TaxID=3364590 RepID=UPI0036C3DE8C
MQHVDPIEQARRLVHSRFPEALSAILGGSTASGNATASSDLDIVVLIEDGGLTCRETIRFEERVVELFVHTRTGLLELFAADVATRRAVLQNMYTSGLVLIDTDGEAGRARALAEAGLREGPPALKPETVDTKRYGLTDALDDLADARDAVERLAVAGYVVSAAADLLCDHHHAWVGGGKWFPRRLREAEPQRGAALLDGHLHLCGSGDPTALISAGPGCSTSSAAPSARATTGPGTAPSTQSITSARTPPPPAPRLGQAPSPGPPFGHPFVFQRRPDRPEAARAAPYLHRPSGGCHWAVGAVSGPTAAR